MTTAKTNLPSTLLQVALAAAAISSPLHADSYTWNGGGADDAWSTGANWIGGVPPLSAADTGLEFAGSTRLTPDADAPWDLGSLTFATGAGAFTLTGSTLNLASGGTVTNSSTTTQTIANTSINLPGASTWDTSAGDLTVSSSITGNPVFFNQTGSVVKTGAGTLTFSGSNSYGEGTTVKSGTLALVAGGSIDNSDATVTVGAASGDNGTIVIDGGQLTSQSLILGDDGSTGRVVVNDGTFRANSQVLIGGGFTGGGAGSFEVHGGNVSTFGSIFVGYVGTGTMTMTAGTLISENGVNVGANDGTGTMVVSGGTLSFDGGTSISAGSTLTISGSASYAMTGMYVDGTFQLDGGVVTGSSQGLIGGFGEVGSATVNSGTWTQSSDMTIGIGSGTLTVNGGYASVGDTVVGLYGDGTINVTSGTLQHTAGVTLGGYDYMGTLYSGTGNMSVSGGLLSTSGTLAMAVGNGVASLSISGSAGNRGTLSTPRIVKGAGTGSINIDGGILQARANESDFISGFAAGEVTLGEGGAIVDTQAFSVGIATSLSGTGGLTKVGTGTLALSGSSTFTGDTTVEEGTLLLTAGSELRFVIEDGDESNQILGTGILDLDGTLRLDISGLTASSGTWNLVAAGTLTETYGASFGLAFVGGPAFISDGLGNYTSGDWTYSQGTGTLTLVPEPGTASLLLGGATIALLARRRRTAR